MKDQASIHLTRHSSATPEAAYTTLANLDSHKTWAGDKQLYNFRLRSLEAPAGPAAVGTTFVSSGNIPMSLHRFEDRSTVTVAERPKVFEFVTESRVHRGRKPMEATYRHRYEIAAAPGGSTVTYTMTQLRASNPFLRLSLPGIRTLTWRIGIPFMAGRGFRALLATAERASRPDPASQRSTPAHQ